MAVWRDNDGTFETYTLLPRSLVAQGLVAAFAEALLEVWNEAAQEGEQLDLREALQRLRDESEGPEAMMDRYEGLMVKYDQALERYEDVLERHNRVVERINALRRQEKDVGLSGRERRRLEENEEVLPEARDKLREAADQLDAAIENAARLGQKIRSSVIAVHADLGSPSLRQPTDPRRTDDRVAEVAPMPKEPDVGSTRLQRA